MLLGKEINLRVEILLLILVTSSHLSVSFMCYYFLHRILCSVFYFLFLLQKRPFYSLPNAVYLLHRSSGFATCAMASSGFGTRSSFSTQSISTNEPVVSVDWLHANLKEPDLKVPESCY